MIYLKNVIYILYFVKNTLKINAGEYKKKKKTRGICLFHTRLYLKHAGNWYNPACQLAAISQNHPCVPMGPLLVPAQSEARSPRHVIPLWELRPPRLTSSERGINSSEGGSVLEGMAVGGPWLPPPRMPSSSPPRSQPLASCHLHTQCWMWAVPSLPPLH